MFGYDDSLISASVIHGHHLRSDCFGLVRRFFNL